jgi:hypothetical protein
MQTSETNDMQLRVIGAHLPRLDQADIASFIKGDVASFKQTMRDLIARGVATATLHEVEERALELPGELDADLQRCALFEVEVTGNSQEFDPTEFSNAVSGYLGWEPVFLSMDGEQVVTEAYKAPPSLVDFRVAFYIHEWDEPGKLLGPTGDALAIPPFTPVPVRLWKLAPYACVD